MHERGRLGLVAAIIVLAGLLLGAAAAPQAAASHCVFAPAMAELPIGQGLPYSTLAPRREALGKGYLALGSLPSCAGKTPSIKIVGARLVIRNGSTVLATVDAQPEAIGALVTSKSIAQNSPADPKFAIPGSALPPRTTLSFQLSVDYQSKGAAPKGSTEDTYSSTRTVTFTAVSKGVGIETRDLRILAVPMGGSLGTTATASVENAMTNLARTWPVADGSGSGGPRVGSLVTGTGAGVRYALNAGFVDLAREGLLNADGLFCGTSTNFTNVVSGTTGLQSMLTAWNDANATENDAYRAVGFVPAELSVAPAQGNNCNDGFTVTNSQFAWARALADVSGASTGTGAILAMELCHTFDCTTSTSSKHSLYTNADNQTGDTDRAFDVLRRTWIQDDHSAMKYVSPWNNENTVFERGDFSYLSDCLNPGRTTPCGGSTSVGTAARPVFALDGTTTGGNEAAVVNSFATQNVPETLPDASSPFRFVQKDASGAVVSDLGVPVRALVSAHGHANVFAAGTVGAFAFAFPLAATTTRVELRNNTTLLYARDKSAPPQIVSTSTVAGGSPENYTRDGSNDDIQPAVSPDGAWVAWQSTYDGEVVAVAPIDDASNSAVVDWGGSGEPAWSPDSTKLAYSAPWGSNDGDIQVVTLDTSDGLSFSAPVVVYDADGEVRGDASRPAWSPDGSEIAFEADGDIWKVAANGSTATSPVRLTTSGDASHPTWSQTAGDDRVAFVRTPPITILGDGALGFRARTADDGAVRVTPKKTKKGKGAAKKAAAAKKAKKAEGAAKKGAAAKKKSAEKPTKAAAKHGARKKAKKKTKPTRRSPFATPLESPFTRVLAFHSGAFVVNSVGDESDAAAGDGTCATATGTCTLRAAIQEANAHTGTDAIHFSIGTGAVTIQPMTELPSIADATALDATTQPGFAGSPIIELDGSQITVGSPRGVGLSGGSSVRGLVVNRFHTGVQLGGSSALEASYVGTDATGTLDRGNRGDGVTTSNSGNRIGGTTPAQRNVISGNDGHGIRVMGASTVVEGNYVGLAANGTSALGNCFAGIDIEGVGNRVARNVVSANAGPCAYGGANIELRTSASETIVEGNYIGIDASGTAEVPNAFSQVGIEIGRAYDDTTGPMNNTIGGTTSAAANVIAATGTGIVFYGAATSGNFVQGNYIGTNPAGASFARRGPGIIIDEASGNQIGGTAAGAGNVIANASTFGVAIYSGTRNSVRANSISATGSGLGIDLIPSGVTANDADDADTGPNELQNFPVLTAVTPGAATTVSGTLNSEPSQTYFIEFFASAACDLSGNGEGERFLGAANATTDANGDGSFTAASLGASSAGEYITATATDPDGNTSEFSSCVEVVADTGPPPVDEQGIWTIDPTAGDPESTLAELVTNASEPSWGPGGTIAFSRYDGTSYDIWTIAADGTGEQKVVDAGNWPAVVDGVLAFHRQVNSGSVEFPNLNFEIFLLRSSSTVTVHALDDHPEDVRFTVYFQCGPSTPKHPLLVSEQGTSDGDSTASMTVPTQGHGCGSSDGTATISVRAHDGFLQDQASTDTEVEISSERKPPVGAIAAPTTGTTFLQFDGITLQGSGTDFEDGVLADNRLSWSAPGLLSGTRSGATVPLVPPAGGWTPGSYTLTLTATDGDGTVSDAVTSVITIKADADHDGIPADVESQSCFKTGDNDPLNAFADYDADGIPNIDDQYTSGGPCVKASTYNAIVDFDPDELNVPSTGNIVTTKIRVPYRNMSQVTGSSVRIVTIGNDHHVYNVSADARFANVGWSVKSADEATAKFDRQKLIGFLQETGLVNQRVLICVAGRSSAPSWSFHGCDSTYVKTGG